MDSGRNRSATWIRGVQRLAPGAALLGLWSCAVPDSVRSIETLSAHTLVSADSVNTRTMIPDALGAIELINNPGIKFDEEERRRMNGALERAIDAQHVFGADRSSPYLLKGVVIRFHEVGGGLFGGGATLTLDVQYTLVDGQGQRVYQRRLASGSKSDDRAAVIDDNARQLATLLRQYFSVARGTPPANAATVATNTNPRRSQVPTPISPPIPGSAAPRRTSETTDAPTRLTAAKSQSRTSVTVPAVEIQSLSGAGIDFGAYHALIIGNDRYQRLKPLRNASTDARRLESILQSHYGFKTTLLIDATRKQILESLTRLRHSLGATDNLLIYYAGHGTLDEQADEGYWLPVDADRHNPANWISNSAITTEVRAIRAKHVLVVADSCFSGKLTRGIKPRLKSPDYLKRMAHRASRTALTSGGLEPVLDGGGEGEHSVFASALFSALLANTGVVDTAQMIGFLRHKVYLETEQLPEYGDIRRAGHAGGDFLFVRRQR